MAKVRIGFGTHFEVENEKVGIGTDSALDALHVTGNIIADGFEFGGGGINTFTTYAGFIEKDASVSESSIELGVKSHACLLYTSPSPRDGLLSRMPSSA